LPADRFSVSSLPQAQYSVSLKSVVADILRHLPSGDDAPFQSGVAIFFALRLISILASLIGVPFYLFSRPNLSNPRVTIGLSQPERIDEGLPSSRLVACSCQITEDAAG